MNVEATRAALLAVARAHFAREGYAGAEISRIAADARVTTGAVYHHFLSKKGLFQAVAEELEGEILAVAAAVEADNPWHRIRAGLARLIDVCARPEVQRIIFVEAPQVLGPDEWREIELRYAFGAVRGVLGFLIESGTITPFPIDLVTRTLLAVLREASEEVARAPGNPEVRAQVARFVDGILDALMVETPVRGATIPAERRAVTDRAIAPARPTDAPDAAESADYLFDEDGLPRDRSGCLGADGDSV